MSCCFWWFLLGALLGWLLNWLLCKWTCNCGNKTQSTDNTTTNNTSTVQPVASVAPAAERAEVKPVQAAVSPEPVKPVAYVIDTAAAKAAGFNPKGKDDLTVIEGIGPKINQLFNNAGYHSFAEVALMTQAQMQKILDDAGPRYRLARPDTWAQQSELAANNQWAELKTLQDELDHGV